MKVGYARCSTNENKQDINRQVRELKDAGCEDVVLEFEHGDTAVKPQLNRLLDEIPEGSEIIVLEVSRLARSTKQLCDTIEIIKKKKLCLRILGSITIDCTNGTIDPFTMAVLQIAGVFSELELQIIRERVKSGMANAKAKGSPIGRPKTTKENIPVSFYKYYPSYKTGKINKAELGRLASISRNTVNKYIKIAEAES